MPDRKYQEIQKVIIGAFLQRVVDLSITVNGHFSFGSKLFLFVFYIFMVGLSLLNIFQFIKCTCVVVWLMGCLY